VRITPCVAWNGGVGRVPSGVPSVDVPRRARLPPFPAPAGERVSLAAAIALLSAALAFYVAALSSLFSRAPGWRDQRYFSLAAIAGACYSALNFPTNAGHFSHDVVVISSRIQIAVAAVHSYAWLRYTSVLVGAGRPRLDRVLVPVLAGIGAVGAVTPAFLPGGVREHAFAPFGVYHTALSSPAGDVAYAIVLGLLAVPIARLAVAWRRGTPTAGLQLVALVSLLAMSTSDAMVVAGLYSAPYLVDMGFLLPAAAVGYGLTSRFVEDAKAHQALRASLEKLVAERTAELGTAQEALHRAEKLAALGQFAAGVAHEVNNPAAVIGANLSYLEEAESDAMSEDGRNAVKESVQSVQRIAVIVRQLLDAGRLAASPEARSSVPLRPLGEGAMSVARARFGKRVRVTNSVPAELCAWGHEGVLAQVLVNLVANAVQAIPDHRSDGHVVIRAEVSEDRVRLVVDDNGTGMEPEVLRRAFEPFFTTKPFGSGTGLGLAVSRGLILSLGGDLRLESRPGDGTRAVIDLASAPAPTPRVQPSEESERRPRLQLLVIDDESAIRSSMRRLLEPRFRVEVAAGVDEGLERMERSTFDLVLCDVMMPAGGGERFYRSVAGRTPGLARRIVFFTGGAVTDAARQFLRDQPQPVLHKPLDVNQLVTIAERVQHS
jgi:signal transduction histidine kinase/CheY-like chemotaxis protein